MHAMTFDSPEWQTADRTDQQAVVNWVNTLDLPHGHVINMLHGDGGLVVEYGWDAADGTPCRDVHACTASEPPPEFWVCARRIAPDMSGGDRTPDVLVSMGGALLGLSWQMVLELGRRLRLWF